MTRPPHTMIYGGREVAVEGWMLLDPVGGDRRFDDPREAAEHIVANPEPLRRIAAVYDGEAHRVCPYAAVSPVMDAIAKIRGGST